MPSATSMSRARLALVLLTTSLGGSSPYTTTTLGNSSLLIVARKVQDTPSLMDTGGGLTRGAGYSCRRGVPMPGLPVTRKVLRCCGSMGVRPRKQAAFTMQTLRPSKPSRRRKKEALLFGRLKQRRLKKAEILKEVIFYVEMCFYTYFTRS
ncbi:hypothetical protein ES703_105069 [subsurface metagenome]